MKTRILPVLGVLFAVTLVSRTVALSSEVSPDKTEHHVEETHAAPTHENTGHENTSHDTPKTEHAQTAMPTDHAENKQCLTGDVLESINAKMVKLRMREAEIAQQEAAFTAIEGRLKKQLAVVEAAKNALAKDVATRTAVAQQDITHLTAMYQTMKPKQAAAIFDKMDPNFAAGFLREMDGGRAGLILAAMNTTKAYEISLVIASRNAQYRPRADKSLP